MKMRWSEKAKRLIKEYHLDFNEIESRFQTSNEYVHIIENGGKKVVFSIDGNNNVEAEVRLW